MKSRVPESIGVRLIVSYCLVAAIGCSGAPSGTGSSDERAAVALNARQAFYEDQDMVLAEKLYRRVIWHPDATETHRAGALWMVAAHTG